MTKINATVVADSVNEQGDRLTSFLITFPRILLSEINTHRMLSKNTSSSRAIPFNKMVETIQNDPFIPVAWQKGHKGMQGKEYFGSELFETHKPSNWRQPIDAEEDETYVEVLTAEWLMYRDSVVEDAVRFNSLGVTKQLCNRLLEPFMWTTMLITGPKSGWDNFFSLRCPIYTLPYNFTEYGKIIKEGNLTFRSRKDILIELPFLKTHSDLDWLKLNKGQAEIHMMALAECIWDAKNESTPKVLKAGDWHIPFEDKMTEPFFKVEVEVGEKREQGTVTWIPLPGVDKGAEEWLQQQKVKVSVAMAARTSYTVVGEEKSIDYEAMIGLHDRLLAQDPPHSSPLEHCARCMEDEEYFHFTKTKPAFTEEEKNRGNEVSDFGWCNNFKGFIPYRYIIDNCLTL